MYNNSMCNGTNFLPFTIATNALLSRLLQKEEYEANIAKKHNVAEDNVNKPTISSEKDVFIIKVCTIIARVMSPTFYHSRLQLTHCFLLYYRRTKPALQRNTMLQKSTWSKKSLTLIIQTNSLFHLKKQNSSGNMDIRERFPPLKIQ